ncbi:unnamed protein product, partial [Didymodactylos carnosus]
MAIDTPGRVNKALLPLLGCQQRAIATPWACQLRKQLFDMS